MLIKLFSNIHDTKILNNKLHCPTCGSTNIRKIPTSKRVTGGILFGLFSGNIGKTFECLDCKYKW